ncbi:MAG: hypothetical protein ACFFCW_16480 [Candidatus Hodarchaeota archaeon]
MQLIDNALKQVTVFRKSGTCVLNLDYWDHRVNEELFSSLLSAINTFSTVALGLELCEISTQEHRLFLSRTDHLIVALVVDESVCKDLKIKSNILSLLERICMILETIDQLWTQKDPNALELLKKKIKVEIAKIFPTSWIRFTSDEQFLNDIIQIRILTHLSDQNKHSMTGIGKQLCLTNTNIKDKLSILNQEGFVNIENVAFGRNIRKKYAITEMGKLALNELETRFPGLWF